MVPEGWTFTALREDGFAVVCCAGHPLTRKRCPDWEDLAQHTWLMLPAGLAARKVFDVFVAQFPIPAVTYPVVTRSAPLMWWLLLQQRLVALLPLNLAHPLVESGQLAQIHLAESLPALEPIGLLCPVSAQSAAGATLSSFLKSNGHADAWTRPGRGGAKRPV